MRVVLIVFGIVISLAGRSQEILKHGDVSTWFMTQTQLNFNPKWQLGLELHERMSGTFQPQSQFLIRPYVSYRAGTTSFFFGYTNLNLAKNDLYGQPIRKFENNIWEQVLLRFDAGKFRLQNRFRQEHRWSEKIVTANGSSAIDGVAYSNRFHLQFVAEHDLIHFKNDRKLFGLFMDELWVNQNAQLLPTGYARNWLFLGVGYAINKHQNVQLRFLHQYDKVGTTSTYISTPIIQGFYLLDMHLKDKKKS